MAQPNPYSAPREPAGSPASSVPWALVALPAGLALVMPFVPFRSLVIALWIALVVVSGLLVMRDAARLGQGHPAWMAGTSVLYPLALPFYLVVRRWWVSPPVAALLARVALPLALVGMVGLGVATYFHGQLLGPPARVTVSCRARTDVPKDGYLCEAQHMGGYKSARACWDLALECGSGQRLVEHACAQSVRGKRREGLVPLEYTPGIEECTSVTQAFVENLKVEVDP